MESSIVPQRKDRHELLQDVRRSGPFTIGENFLIIDEDYQPELAELQMWIDSGWRMVTQGQWIIVDAMSYVSRLYPDRIYDVNIRGFPYTKGYIRNLIYVGNWWLPEFRIPGVSPQFHMVLTPRLRKAVIAGDTQDIEACRQWVIDARDLDMTRPEFLKAARENPIPPSFRIAAAYNVPELTEFVVRDYDGELRQAAGDLVGLRIWLHQNGGGEFELLIDRLTELLALSGKWFKQLHSDNRFRE